MMIQLVAAGVIAMVLYVSGFATGWKVDTWKNTSDMAAQVKAANDARDEARAQRDLVSNQFETKLANLRIVHTTIHQEVQHEIEKTVYGDPNCNLPASGVSLRNAAIDAANGGSVPGQPDAAVPADSKTSGGFLGRLIPSGPRAN